MRKLLLGAGIGIVACLFMTNLGVDKEKPAPMCFDLGEKVTMSHIYDEKNAGEHMQLVAISEGSLSGKEAVKYIHKERKSTKPVWVIHTKDKRYLFIEDEP